MIDLSSRSALVTGGGQGIGKEIALTLAKAGADVAICDLNLDAAKSTADEISSLGRQSLALKADVSNGADVKAMIKNFIEKFGKIDILINNAGITRDGLVVRMKESDWDLVLSVNLKSCFLCSKEVARPMMKARFGKIVNIASVIGLMGNAGQANYAAAKAGMIGVTKSLAKEFASRNINVNAVAPGFISSAMTDKLTEEDREAYSSAIPMKKLGNPSDVANAILFLVSDLSGYITGQVVTVDGGLVM